jgi:hypothetical protein
MTVRSFEFGFCYISKAIKNIIKANIALPAVTVVKEEANFDFETNHSNIDLEKFIKTQQFLTFNHLSRNQVVSLQPEKLFISSIYNF